MTMAWKTMANFRQTQLYWIYPYHFLLVEPRSQEALTLETRSKSIPLPKAKAAAGKAKPKVAAKAKAVPEPDGGAAKRPTGGRKAK